MDLQETNRFVKKVAIILFCYAYNHLSKNEEKTKKKENSPRMPKRPFLLTNLQYFMKTSNSHQSHLLDQRMGDCAYFAPKIIEIIQDFIAIIEK